MEERGYRSRFAISMGVAFLVSLLLVCSVYGLTFRDRFYSLVSKGNKLYAKEKNQEALDKYLKARSIDSTSVIPGFNAGDAYYRLGKFDQAVKEFSSATSGRSDRTSAMAYYNMGNSFFNLNDLRSSAEAYKRALLIDPGDEDAKYNLELVLRMLKQQEKQGGKSDQKDKSKDEKQEEQKECDKNRDQKPNTGEGNRESMTQEFQPRNIDEQQLQRILAAIEASDREVQRELMKKRSSVRKVVGKDW